MIKSILWAAFAALFLQCCSVSTKNNPVTRNYRAFITRFNVHYNGEKHYKESVAAMEQEFEDDYTRKLPIHPAEASEHVRTRVDFTRSIEKARKAIQLHSIKRRPVDGRKREDRQQWRSRSEYNPFLHNSWMLLGKSLYMQGKFEDASAVFIYISRHFIWLPSTVDEARLWEARCYCALYRLYEASRILEQFDPNKLTEGELRLQYHLAAASLAIKDGNHGAAVEGLYKAERLSGRNQRLRLKFIKARELQEMGKTDEAYIDFMDVADNVNVSARQRMYALVSASHVVPANKRAVLTKRLLRLAVRNSGIDNGELVYNALGNVCLQDGDTLKALGYYARSAADESGEGYGRMMSLFSSGNLHYNIGEYSKARECYDSAIPLMAADDENLAVIQRRNRVLDKILAFKHEDVDLVSNQDDGKCHSIDSLFNTGVLLKDELNDYQAATRVFKELLARFPGNVYSFDVYYNLFVMNVLLGDKEQAENYRELIAREFPSNSLGRSMASPDFLEHMLKQHEETSALYEEAYQNYKAGETSGVHRLVGRVEAEYPLSSLMAKFKFLDAMSYAAEADDDNFKIRLMEITAGYPNADVYSLAAAMLEKVNEGRRLIRGNPPAAYQHKSVEATLTTDKDADVPVEDTVRFVDRADSPSNILLLYPIDKVSGNQLLYDVAKFNFTNFIARELDISFFSDDGPMGSILVKGFANRAEAEYYQSKLSGALGSAVMIFPLEDENLELIIAKEYTVGRYLEYLELSGYRKAQSMIPLNDDMEAE